MKRNKQNKTLSFFWMFDVFHQNLRFLFLALYVQKVKYEYFKYIKKTKPMILKLNLSLKIIFFFIYFRLRFFIDFYPCIKQQQQQNKAIL